MIFLPIELTTKITFSLIIIAKTQSIGIKNVAFLVFCNTTDQIGFMINVAENVCF